MKMAYSLEDRSQGKEDFPEIVIDLDDMSIKQVEYWAPKISRKGPRNGYFQPSAIDLDLRYYDIYD